LIVLVVTSCYHSKYLAPLRKNILQLCGDLLLAHLILAGANIVEITSWL